MEINRKFYFGTVLIGLLAVLSLLVLPQRKTAAKVDQSSSGNEQYLRDTILSSSLLSEAAANEEQSTITTTATGDKMIKFPANALNYDATSTIITGSAAGLLWQANYQNAAFLMINKPDDWDGVSDVTMHFFFAPTTSTPGNVEFFIRPRAYNPGDMFGDIINLDSDPVPVSQANQVKEQTITIPASRFSDKQLWVITIQREGAGATYPDNVMLYSVALSYSKAVDLTYLPIITK